MDQEERRARLTLVFIVLLGLGLRLYGINWGLPYLYNVDERLFISEAIGVLSDRDLNPHWFGAPGTTLIYLLALSYAAIFAAGVVTGAIPDAAAYKSLYRTDPTLFCLTGRVLATFIGVGSIVLTYLIAKRFFGRRAGLVAAALMALNPLHIEHSQLVRMDVLMTAFLLVSFWLAVNGRGQGRVWVPALSGFFGGLAVATKYPAVVMAPIILMVTYVGRGSGGRHLSQPLIAGGGFLIGAFIGSPFLFLDFGTVLSDVLREHRPTHVSATGTGFLGNMLWYVQKPLAGSLGLAGLCLAVAGVILCLWRRERHCWALIAFPCIFLIFVALLHLRWDRWIIPVLPFLCILASCAFSFCIDFLAKRQRHRAGMAWGISLVVVTLAPLVYRGVVQQREIAGKDTITLARDWVVQNVPQGSRVLIEMYSPHLPKLAYEFYVVETGSGNLVRVDTARISDQVVYPPYTRIGEVDSVETIIENHIQYVVLADGYDRYLEDMRRFPEYARVVERYQKVMELGEAVYEVAAVAGRNRGPTMRVYRLPTGS